jgi:hypothetical protein
VQCCYLRGSAEVDDTAFDPDSADPWDVGAMDLRSRGFVDLFEYASSYLLIKKNAQFTCVKWR